ncbi:acyl-CoA reductase [Kribbella sp. NPDC056861]|uniref:acyl-CoA reductase n=1 Tax=Kribbella sp. NPDC056861 TaxID=3154857 RepID=UPI003420DB6C
MTKVRAFVRGELVDGPTVSFGSGATSFQAVDPALLAGRITLTDPVLLNDVHQLTTDEIVDLLAEVGSRLVLDRNELLAESLELLRPFSNLTDGVLRATYEQIPSLFEAETVRAVAERTIGTAYLDGWVDHGRGRVRAFGARAVHVIAGNNPIIAAITVVRNAICRGDGIIKLPANDPFTAVAIARTMAGVAPEHPLVRHLSVAYWKGGDEDFERRLYLPSQLEKIVAWGGFASVRHVTGYLQPGLELIALDPKLSATVIGPEALADEETMRRTAFLAAADVGLLNQEGCFNARVIYLAAGLDSAGIERANRWGELVHAELSRLPERVSAPAYRFDPALRADIQALRTSPDWYRVIGGSTDEGAVIVSQSSEPVDFQMTLSGRVVNVVPVADPLEAVRAMNTYTQTVGVYPESLKLKIRDTAPLYGVQRLVPLGFATHFRPELPQDAIEPTRRMMRWIVDEEPPPGAHPFDQLAPGAAVMTP